MDKNNILEMKKIIKQYTGVAALTGVDFLIKRNTIHCIACW
jgi:ABC-type sugar transport system ATPase subunit